MKRLVVLGGGESGVGTALLGKEKGFEVFVSDYGKLKEEYKDVLIHNEIEWEEGTHTSSKILNADVQYLNVNHIRDFIHVNDIVNAVQIMMDNSFRGVVDVGTGISNKLVDIADYFKIDYKSVIGDETERLDNTADTSILNKFGWRAKINLYNYIEENRNVN